MMVAGSPRSCSVFAWPESEWSSSTTFPICTSTLPECLARARTNNDPCTLDESKVPTSTPLGRAVALMPPGEIDYLNFKDVFCDGAVCHTVIGGIPAYMDNSHITPAFAGTLAPRLEKLIAKNDPAAPHRPPSPTLTH